MSRYVYNSKKDKYKKVAKFNTTLMASLRDVIPNDRKIAKELLVKTKDAPTDLLRDIYSTQDNTALIRKIFVVCLKAILIEIASGRCEFIVPAKGRTNPKIFVSNLPDHLVKIQSFLNKNRKIDLKMTDYQVPYLAYKFSENSKRQPLFIYLNKNIYQELIDHANTGQKFSVRPRTIEYFLPVVYEEFSYIEEQQLEKIVKYCFSQLQKWLKRGEEVRIIDKDGEIRFFRPLGKLHDKVMRKVVKKRLTIERKKRYEKFS